jgi:hypothetical protein
LRISPTNWPLSFELLLNLSPPLVNRDQSIDVAIDPLVAGGLFDQLGVFPDELHVEHV